MAAEGFRRVAFSKKTWAVSSGLLSVGAVWLKISGMHQQEDIRKTLEGIGKTLGGTRGCQG
jgi:hypothetical protein